MKWVNASEQMPNGIRHNVKYKGNADVIYFYNNEWAFDNREGMRVFKLDWQHIEWLDESPTPDGWVSVEQLTAAEARIKELESQMADSLMLYECQNNAVIKRDERIKELEAGLVNLRHGLFKDEQAVNNYIDQLLTK